MKPREPLTAVPLVAPGVRASASGHGLRLSRPPSASGRFARFLEDKLGWTRARTFELDQRGAAFFQAIDGARNLEQIETLLVLYHGLEPAAGRACVIEYTKTLLARGLIALRLEHDA